MYSHFQYPRAAMEEAQFQPVAFLMRLRPSRIVVPNLNPTATFQSRIKQGSVTLFAAIRHSNFAWIIKGRCDGFRCLCFIIFLNASVGVHHPR